MKHILVDILSQMTPLTEEEKEAIANSFPIKTYQTGTFLLKEGQVAKEAYFLIDGCIREYELLDGEENTTEFFTENMSVANFQSMATGSPSKKFFVCNETSTVAIVNAQKEEELYKKHPRFESFCRAGMEQMLGEKQSLLAELISLKPEQRYLKLQKERPELLNRVPQYQIASYLGISPETLSRIRKRLVKN